ncbi:hypothetical protein INR49_009507 [Caranx melampygus]|nr:hypothetical protein INR49_009507 [Caranx melampygus]
MSFGPTWDVKPERACQRVGGDQSEHLRIPRSKVGVQEKVQGEEEEEEEVEEAQWTCGQSPGWALYLGVGRCWTRL